MRSNAAQRRNDGEGMTAMPSSKTKKQNERYQMGFTKTDVLLKHTPKKSEVLLRNGLGKIFVAKTTASVEAIATTEEH
jgi:hypothetical protein